jgi:glutamate dehydrogenase
VAPSDAADELIDKVVTYGRAQGHDAPKQLETFLRQYFDRTTPDDLGTRKVVDLFGQAMAHLDLAAQRAPGVPNVRVYLPDFETDGWQCTHTAIDIVTDDMPFLVDSVTNELNRHNLRVHLVIHPILRIRRSSTGALTELLEPDAPEDGARRESFLHVQVDRQRERDLERLRADLVDVLTDVRRAVEDWVPMRERASALAGALDEGNTPGDIDDVSEAAALLRWMADDHFTFLGYRDYDLAAQAGGPTTTLAGRDGVRSGGDEVLVAVPGTGLGILRDEADPTGTFARLPPAPTPVGENPAVLVLAKADARSTVHRRGYLDYVGLARFDERGEKVGERLFLGLFEARPHDSSVFDVPVIRRTVRRVVEQADLPPEGHSYRRLRDILESYPRDELFQIGEDDLLETSIGILRLQQRQRVRLFVRRDLFERFVSCLVYVPRDRYNTAVREQMAGILTDAFGGTSVDFTAHLTESVLARVHFVVHTAPGVIPDVDTAEVEERLADAVRSWTDDLRDTLVEECGEQKGVALYHLYGDAFPAAYREEFPVRAAATDMRRLHALDDSADMALSLYRPHGAPRTLLRLKIYRSGTRVSLSEVLPLLEAMGVTVVDERPYEIAPSEGPERWIYDFGLQVSEGASREIDNNRSLLLDALDAVWRGEAESDGFNRLVLEAGLAWREVSVVRAYSRYLRQLGTTFGQTYISQCLAAHPDLVRLLGAIFDARFNPDRPGDRAADIELLDLQADAALDDIISLDEDRILRSFRNLVRATVRTNFYQRTAEGIPPACLALKLDPTALPEAPEPRPTFEIFVYSPTVEGVHLRGRRVARGGIRWSDRREDFRTEILGLMKAQMVKNSVIVPGGAKGGFVVKRPLPPDRDEAMQVAIAAYRTFISALLDLTDNLVSGGVVSPERVVRYDDDDPYLVVAADKGTATFSDIANAISLERGFWLGDAFASGGSSGYDHKAMGITARGAWESVKRHFRALGLDPGSTDFTAVGVGDMSGDVFGNGMLLSPHIRLVGAFDHRHVFLDPDPDPEASFRERRRLFELPRSSWDDYDRTLISAGGGVFPRSAKKITLSPEVRRRLVVSNETLTPDELIRAILRSPVDLLWNGGIGTYAKASTESHADVGDKANDGVRVNAGDLRCRVVAEGGNLGFTQRARVEFALGGGRIFTDAIDNSAGVDCSDHEVNIKILLDSVVAAGDLTAKQRDELLEAMADEVATQVLEHNDGNTLALSIAATGAASLADVHARYITDLEATGRIDRELEYLPSAEEMAERIAHNQGLTTPEFAVLLAHTKLMLSDAVVLSDLPDDPYLEPVLAHYFPHQLPERYRQQMLAHPLRREIIATCVSNLVVNRAGTSFLYRMADETQADLATIARSHLAASAMFDLPGLWAAIEALDHHVACDPQIEMFLAVRQLIERATRWLLTRRAQPIDLQDEVDRFAPRIAALDEDLSALLVGDDLERYRAGVERLVGFGAPLDLASKIARLDALLSALDIIDVCDETGQPVLPVAAVYFELGHRLHLDALRDQVGALPRDDRWRTLARSSLRGDLYACQRILVAEAVRDRDLDGDDIGELLDTWAARRAAAIERYEHVVADFSADDTPDLAALSVAVRAVHELAGH